MKKNKFYLALILFFTLLSCSEEETTYEKETNALPFLKENLDLKKSRNANISTNLFSDFIEINSLDKNDKKIYEYKIEEITKTALESDFVTHEINYSLFVTNIANNYNGYLLETFTLSKSNTEFPITLLKSSTFSGYSNIYNLKGKYIGQIGFQNGFASSTNESSVLNELLYFLNLKENSNLTTSKIIACNHVVTIRTETYEDIYYQWEDGAGNIVDITFGYSRYLGTTVTYQNIPYPCDSPEGDEKQIVHRGRVYTPVNINQIVVEGPEIPVTNIIQYLECIDPYQPTTITIYANQPTPNSSTPVNIINGDVGHAFITIKQGNEIATFGFYPANGWGTGFNGPTVGQMGNNSGQSFDVSITTTVTSITLQNILINSIESATQHYSLNDNNCTDFAIGICNIIGLNIPDCYGSWLGGGGSNPGAFGQYLRNMSLPNGVTRNTTGGNAPQNHKGC